MNKYFLNYIICLFSTSFFTTNYSNGQIQPVQKYQLADSSAIEVEFLDTIVFSPNQTIQSVEDLVFYIQNDTTFYKAFKNLHFTNYNADHDVKIYNKSGKNIQASLLAETKHIYRNKCRWMNVLDEQITGNYLNKNKKPKYYTSELYHSLFYEKDTICNEVNKLSKSYLNPTGNTIEKNKAQLKLLMFSPGTKIKGIPLIGNKASIFDPEVSSNYIFTMSNETKNGIACILFEAIPKPGLEHKVIYQSFKTWFNYWDMSIVARDYRLKFDHSFYDFDVTIKVNLTQKNDQLLVRDIFYLGNWRVISQGREVAQFKSIFYH